MKEIKALCRPNIWRLAAYSCARTEFSGRSATVFLDANENPFNKPFNRYPDPLQQELKQLLSAVKGVPAENIFLGNGSDEAIDLPYRIFCEPGIDNVVAIAPTYGMYEVCADVNNVEYRPVLLDADYRITADKLLGACDAHTKLMWICSPNNPTGNLIDREAIEKVLQMFQGIVIIDEAYGEFRRPGVPSALELLAESDAAGPRHPHLAVARTMSKAFGMAGLRLGYLAASRELVDALRVVRLPYHLSALTQAAALAALDHREELMGQVASLRSERDALVAWLRGRGCTAHESDANFVLFGPFEDRDAVFAALLERGVLIRVVGPRGYLRVSIGTPDEMEAFRSALVDILKETRA